MSKCFLDREAGVWVWVQQALNQVFGLGCDFIFQIVTGFNDLFVQVFHVICLERDSAVQHSEQDNARAPQVRFKPFVAFILNYLGSDVGGRTTLLIHYFTGLYLLAHAEVSDLYVALAIK